MTRTERRTWLMAVVLLCVAMAAPVYGQEAAESEITIEQAVMARRIEARVPVGEGTTFPADIGQVACYTKVMGAKGETFVEHVWFRGEAENARVRLPVRSAAWRTWSTRQIKPDWTGEWKVQIEDSEGRVLDTLTFTIGEESDPGSAD